MKVLIIEDEKLAIEYLQELLKTTGYDIQIAGTINSVKNGIKWFLKNPEPDLIFMDIDLGDGLCFEFFDVIDISCPIIFTTAYDEYAIKAFKVNSIDYLLKPVDQKELKQALEKYSRLTKLDYKAMEVKHVARMLSGPYKTRFILKIGDRLKSLPAKDIMFFTSRDKATYAAIKEGRTYLIDYSLDRLNGLLDPLRFFRINRKYIINYQALQDIISYTNSRLKVSLSGNDDDGIIVARDRVGDFKAWLDR